MIYCNGVTLFWGLASDDLSVPYGNNHANEPHLGHNDPLRLASALRSRLGFHENCIDSMPF